MLDKEEQADKENGNYKVPRQLFNDYKMKGVKPTVILLTPFKTKKRALLIHSPCKKKRRRRGKSN